MNGRRMMPQGHNGYPPPPPPPGLARGPQIMRLPRHGPLPGGGRRQGPGPLGPHMPGMHGQGPGPRDHLGPFTPFGPHPGAPQMHPPPHYQELQQHPIDFGGAFGPHGGGYLPEPHQGDGNRLLSMFTDGAFANQDMGNHLGILSQLFDQLELTPHQMNLATQMLAARGSHLGMA